MDNELIRTLLTMLFDRLPEIMVGVSSLVVGLFPLLAKKLALKKAAKSLAFVLAKHREISADHKVTEAEYAEFGRAVYPIVDEFEGRVRGWFWNKSK